MENSFNKHKLARSLQSITSTQPLLILSANVLIPPRCKSLPNINLRTDSKESGGGSVNLPGKKSRPKILKKTWNKVKKTIMNPSSTSASVSPKREGLKSSSSFTKSYSSSAPNTPNVKKSFEFSGTEDYSECSETHKREEEDENVDKIQKSYALLQKRLSEELRQIVGGTSSSSHYSQMGKPEKDSSGAHSTVSPTNTSGNENLSEEFKKKLQQWEMWKASTGKVTYTDEQLKSILPQDFTKKLHEWESKKSSGVRVGSPEEQSKEIKHSGSKKGKGTRKKQKNSEAARQKELAWLDKQLEKIEVEKKRLEREMKKYLDREQRLIKMKEALKNNSSVKTDVWIRTPTANCKVEKITEKFAKKLYEWEERQGIQPESSTMALLTPEYLASSPPKRTEPEEDDDSSPLLVREIGPLCGERDNKGFEDEYEDEDMNRRRRLSSASSSDFEVTDSYATHEKGNSGTSNTDSDLFRASGVFRRRSSDALSTPLSARSPSLSAFTTDDEGDPPPGLLRTVREREDENEDCSPNIVTSPASSIKDAESQTEGITKAKKIILEDEETRRGSCPLPSGSGAVCKQDMIFVPTKRTLFTPVIEEKDFTEKIVIEKSLTSPSLVRNILQQQVSPNVIGLPPAPPVKLVGNSSSYVPGYTNRLRTQSESDGGNVAFRNFHCSGNKIPPKIVGSVPKWKDQPRPKLGKIPVWCSPLGARRQFNVNNKSRVVRRSNSSDNNGSSMDEDIVEPPLFTIDKFLKDTNLVLQDHQNMGIRQQQQVPGSSSYIPIRQNIPIGSRIPINTSNKISRKYTIGGGIPPREPRQNILTRSNSFGYHREPDDYVNPFGHAFLYGMNVKPPMEESGNVAGSSYGSPQIPMNSGFRNVAVPKSHSSGSIKGFFASKLKFGGKHGASSSNSSGNNEQMGAYGSGETSPVIVTPLESIARGAVQPQTSKKKGGWLSKK